MAGKKHPKRKSVPKGDEFMRGTTTEEIVKARKKERESKAATILLACLHRRKGRNGKEIAEILQKPSSTVYGWLVCMHQGGLDARHDSPKSGRPRRIGHDGYDDIMKMNRRPAGGQRNKVQRVDGQADPHHAGRTRHRDLPEYGIPHDAPHGRDVADARKAH